MQKYFDALTCFFPCYDIHATLSIKCKYISFYPYNPSLNAIFTNSMPNITISLFPISWLEVLLITQKKVQVVLTQTTFNKLIKHISKLKKIENDYVIATKSVPKKVVARLSKETDPCKNWCQMKYLQIERKKKIKLLISTSFQLYLTTAKRMIKVNEQILDAFPYKCSKRVLKSSGHI